MTTFSFAALFSAVDTALAATSADLLPLSLSILGSLAVIRVVWFGLELALSGGVVTSLVGPFVRMILVIFFALWAAKGGLMDGIVSITDHVLDALGVGGGKLAQLGSSGMDTLAAAIGSLGEAMTALINPELLHPFDTIGRLIMYGVPVLILGLAIGTVMAAGIAFFIAVALGAVLLKVAAVLAPLFIPFLILPQTNFLFDGWLKFAIGAALYKPVAAIIAGIGGALLAGMSGILGALPAGGGAVSTAANAAQATLAALGVAGLAGLVLYLMLQVGTISTALVGGASLNAGRVTGAVRNAMRGGKGGGTDSGGKGGGSSGSGGAAKP
ncbi:type IV secretion system protein [Sulfurisoma sediminicola]|uniref:TrbL/VirB6 plasmid conjugal transfer protein n=1 Tax=Sulfurisoma sediminicola TaxID=1381557 RepID=A0A497XEF2_9PROT|nr:type IV secretion system protein [Sulfurisoma sediminicola]RLJ64598.1 TrbL/VirB6 plasmid conjugal transfer protein [Sulfurisoma sediminicola]